MDRLLEPEECARISSARWSKAAAVASTSSPVLLLASWPGGLQPLPTRTVRHASADAEKMPKRDASTQRKTKRALLVSTHARDQYGKYIQYIQCLQEMH